MYAAQIRVLLFWKTEHQLFSVDIRADRQGHRTATHVFGKYSQFLLVLRILTMVWNTIRLYFIKYLALHKRATVLNAWYEE